MDFPADGGQHKRKVDGEGEEAEKPKKEEVLDTFDMFSDDAVQIELVSKAATLASQDSTNASLRDNWDDTEGYYRESIYTSYFAYSILIYFPSRCPHRGAAGRALPRLRLHGRWGVRQRGASHRHVEGRQSRGDQDHSEQRDDVSVPCLGSPSPLYSPSLIPFQAQDRCA